jgi:hypothetical protein
MSKFKRADVIPRKVAQEQIDLLHEFYDVDMAYLTESMQNVMQHHILGLLKAVVRGRLTIKESGEGLEITQKLEGTDTKISYREVGALVEKAVARAESNEGKVHACLAVMSGEPLETFENLPRVDKSTAEDLGNYFLGA